MKEPPKKSLLQKGAQKSSKVSCQVSLSNKSQKKLAKTFSLLVKSWIKLSTQ